MRLHEVQPGDSPASIAIAHVGCPKCAIDLVRANPHKETVTHPNGFVTFKDLHVGENLNLPDKWWSKEFDELPPSYFAALPHPDGVTPPKVPTGVLGDDVTSSPVVTAAQAATAAIAADSSYCASVAHPGSAVNAAVHSFKTVWNAANPGSPVPINTGNYEQATADAITRVLGTAPAACAARSTPFQPPFVTPPQKQDQGLGTGTVVALGLLGIGAVGAAIYLVVSEEPAPAPRVRRIHPSRPHPSTRPDHPVEYWDGTTWRKPYAP
jgi:hypothetical protein